MPRKKNHIWLNSRKKKKKKKKSKRPFYIDQRKKRKKKKVREFKVISCSGERKTTKKQLAHEKEW